MSNEHSIPGTKPSSESRLKRTSAARAQRYRNRLIDIATRPPQWKGSTSDWAKAVVNEIETVLLPPAPNFDLPEPGEKFEHIRRFAADTQMVSAIIDAKKFFDAELNLRERLDGMIDRAIKHLIQLKAWKQMLRQTSGTREDEQPKRITASKGLK